MITLHGEEIRVGDKVWDILRGWGTVTELDENNSDYSICVKWECSRWVGRYEWFTKDGKIYPEDENPLLFWQPVEIEIPKKPKQIEKAWQWICRHDAGSYWLTNMHYTDGEAILEFFPNAEPIEPYLPSEIEREAKE